MACVSGWWWVGVLVGALVCGCVGGKLGRMELEFDSINGLCFRVWVEGGRVVEFENKYCLCFRVVVVVGAGWWVHCLGSKYCTVIVLRYG